MVSLRISKMSHYEINYVHFTKSQLKQAHQLLLQLICLILTNPHEKRIYITIKH